MSDEKQKMMLLYGSEGNGPKIQVLVQDETIWLSQKQMAELFEVSTATINEHLKNIFKDEELRETSVIRNFRITANDGKNYNTKHYSLDAIIAVGYRVNSKQATAFRIWATKVLKEYMIKGFALDDDRLKMAKTLTGKDYFRELLERVRSIRASEQRIWLQVTEIFPSAASITTKTPWRHETFLPASRICFTTRFLDKLPLKLLTRTQIEINPIWA